MAPHPHRRQGDCYIWWETKHIINTDHVSGPTGVLITTTRSIADMMRVRTKIKHAIIIIRVPHYLVAIDTYYEEKDKVCA